MTVHPNARLLDQVYQAIGRGDLQPLLSMLSDDITFEVDLGPLAGTYRGKDEVPEFFARMANLYQGTLAVQVVDIVANDRHAVVLTRESGKVNGEPVAWTGAHVWSFERGRANRFRTYLSAEYQHFWAKRQAALSS
jgi:ketosteroid isomerase-like protein